MTLEIHFQLTIVRKILKIDLKNHLQAAIVRKIFRLRRAFWSVKFVVILHVVRKFSAHPPLPLYFLLRGLYTLRKQKIYGPEPYGCIWTCARISIQRARENRISKRRMLLGRIGAHKCFLDAF